MKRGEHLRQYCFKDGNPGGPGRPPLTPEEKEVRRFTREHVSEVINKIMELTDKEMDALLSDPDAPQFEKLVVKAMAQARLDGDFSRIDSMLDRCIGKVPQRTELDLSGAAVPSSVTITHAPVKSNEKAPDVP